MMGSLKSHGDAHGMFPTNIDAGVIERSEGPPRSRNLCIHDIIQRSMEDFLGMLWMFDTIFLIILIPVLLFRYLSKREAHPILLFVVAMLSFIFYFWFFGLIRWILDPKVNLFP